MMKAEELKKKETSILEMAIRLKVARKNRQTLVERAQKYYETERKEMVDQDREAFREAYVLVRAEERREEEEE